MARPTHLLLRRAVYVVGRLRTRKRFRFLGRSFDVHEGVLNPTTFRASLLFGRAVLRHAPDVRSRVLELGCGSGLAAVLAAYAGHEVTAVDIDGRAVLNTLSNAKRNGVAVRALVSDWDAGLEPEELFDFIIMNPPFLTEEPPAFRVALYAGADLSLLCAGLVAARRRLARNGKLVVLTSDRTGRAAFLDAMGRAGLRVVLTQADRQWFDTYLTDLAVAA